MHSYIKRRDKIFYLLICCSLYWFSTSGQIAQPGALDTTFNPGTAANDAVRAHAIQPDGKILIAGSFNNFNGIPYNRIARLNANGSLDSTFNPGNGVNGIVRALALQPDGRVLIGGEFTHHNGAERNRITRLNADGSLDTTFNPGTGANAPVMAIVLEPNGRVLIGGNFSQYNGTTRSFIARLNADGGLDTTFNFGIGAEFFVRAIALQPNGKVLIGGSFTRYDNWLSGRVARLNTDGSRDSTFSAPVGANNTVMSLAVQTDGKILIGGVFTTYNFTSRGNIARLNANGTLDSSFNPGTGTNGSVNSLRIQQDGKVLMAGFFSGYNGTTRRGIARLQNNGSIDSSFDPGTGIEYWIQDISLQPDGKLMIVGGFTVYNGTPRNRIARVFATNCLAPPPVTVIMAPAAICAGSSATIIPAGGGNYRFFTDSIGGNPLPGGNGVSSFTTPPLSSSATYFVAAVSNHGCESTTRTAVTIEVNPLPTVQIAQTGDSLFTTTSAGSFQWLLDGVEISGATGMNFRPLLSGAYSLRVTSPEGCIGLSNAIQFIATGLEFGNEADAANWSVYPVPFASKLTIQATSPFSYALMDVKGTIVMRGAIETTQVTLQTEELPTGIYLVKIIIHGQTHVRKLMKT